MSSVRTMSQTITTSATVTTPVQYDELGFAIVPSKKELQARRQLAKKQKRVEKQVVATNLFEPQLKERPTYSTTKPVKQGSSDTKTFFRTQACKFVKKTDNGSFVSTCRRADCTYAHSLSEVTLQTCNYGDGCNRDDCYYHHPSETVQGYCVRVGRECPDLPEQPIRPVTFSKVVKTLGKAPGKRNMNLPRPKIDTTGFDEKQKNIWTEVPVDPEILKNLHKHTSNTILATTESAETVLQQCLGKGLKEFTLKVVN